MSGARAQILIVDDSLVNIEFLGNVLGREFEVSFATSGAEALTLTRRNPINLILLDVVMPEMNGYEVCKRLKSDVRTCDIPVIFLTSLESAAEEEYSLSLGALDFIHKPASPPVVLARVRNHLLLANMRRELQQHNAELEKLVAQRTQEVYCRDQQLIAAQTATITAFCALVETRDNETGNHIRRTQMYVELLAKKLHEQPKYQAELSEEAIRWIARSAPLHDIGKVGVPDAVLLKPGKLTPEEWEIMKRHCVLGRDVLSAATQELQEEGYFLHYAASIAYCHHERWNGKGYPQGLSGTAIPLCARLMAVADVYDALTTRRVYKEAYSHEESMRLMLEERGAHFDPDVIDALVTLSDAFQDVCQRYKD